MRTDRLHSRIALLILSFLLMVPAVRGQDEEKNDTSRSDLIRAIRAADRNIEKLEARRKKEKTRQVDKLQAIKQENRNLADRILSLRLEIKKLFNQVEETKKKKERLEQKVRDKRTERTKAVQFVRDAKKKLQNLASGLPPSKDRQRQKKIIRETKGTVKNAGASVRTLLDVMIELLEEGVETQLFQSEVRTPDGRTRRARILRLGRSFIAYSTRQEDQTGIALKGDGRYHWQTDLPQRYRRRISEAMKRVDQGGAASGASSRVRLPVDPTTNLSLQLLRIGKSLRERLMAGGPVMIPLGLIAVIALLFVLERSYSLFGARWGMEKLVRDVLQRYNEGHPEDALALCRGKSGAIPNVLARVLEERNQSPEDLQDEIEEAILHEIPALERFLSALKVLAAVAPLLGLLGTVTGIIETFDVISVFGAGKQRIMAGGISETLITTATGLAIAIPILLLHGYFRSRADAVISDMERHATTLYNAVTGGGDIDQIEVDEESANETSDDAS